MNYTPHCWFAQNVIGCGPCDGQLVRVHLIPRQVLRREGLKWLVNDERFYVWGCGGPTGLGGHHGMLDHSRTLRIPREALPPVLEQGAADMALTWYLEREYGPLCGFCQGKPVIDARSWTDGKERVPVACPLCGRTNTGRPVDRVGDEAA